jgi:hypothetical protein
MDTRPLSREEAKALGQSLGPRMFCLNRLCDRMNHMGIDPEDEVFMAARQAENAMHSLGVLAHYRSCENGVAELPR